MNSKRTSSEQAAQLAAQIIRLLGKDATQETYLPEASRGWGPIQTLGGELGNIQMKLNIQLVESGDNSLKIKGSSNLGPARHVSSKRGIPLRELSLVTANKLYEMEKDILQWIASSDRNALAFLENPIRALADMDLELSRADLKNIKQIRAANQRVAPDGEGYQIIEETLTVKKPRAKRQSRTKTRKGRQPRPSKKDTSDVEVDTELKARLEGLNDKLLAAKNKG